MKVFFYALTLTTAMSLVSCFGPTSSGGDDDSPASGHDGSESSPVLLALEDPFSGKIGSSDDLSDSESFYRFNSGSETDFLVTISSSQPAHTGTDDYDLRLYSDAAMTNQLELSSPNDHTSPYYTGLTPSTTYYLKLFNKVDQATTYTITVRGTPSPLHDGALGGPINLALSVSNTTTMTVTSVTGEDTSYYYFMPTSSGTATISYPEGTLDGDLYSNSDFSNGWIAGEFSMFTSSFQTTVAASTVYYLKITHDSVFQTRIRGNLTVTVQ